MNVVNQHFSYPDILIFSFNSVLYSTYLLSFVMNLEREGGIFFKRRKVLKKSSVSKWPLPAFFFVIPEKMYIFSGNTVPLACLLRGLRELLSY